MKKILVSSVVVLAFAAGAGAQHAHRLLAPGAVNTVCFGTDNTKDTQFIAGGNPRVLYIEVHDETEESIAKVCLVTDETAEAIIKK